MVIRTTMVVACLWVVGPASAAPPVPDGALGAVERAALERAGAFLRDRAPEALDEEEPCFGFLLSLAGLALYSAGEDVAFHRVEAWLHENAEKVTDFRARVLGLHVMALEPPSAGEGWESRAVIMLEWLYDVLQQVAPSKRRMPGLAGSPGLRRTMTRRLDRPRAGIEDLRLLGIACAAIRASERIGFTTGPLEERVPQAWATIAQDLQGRVGRKGTPNRESGDASAVAATAAGMLAVTLARTALVDPEKLDKGLLRQQRNLAERLDGGLKFLDGAATATSEASDPWGALLEAVLLSRLSWSVGDREVEVPLRAVLKLQRGDGSFDFEDPLPAEIPAELREYYGSDRVRPLVATSLAVLALSQTCRRVEHRPTYSVLSRATPQLTRKPGAKVMRTLEDLIRCDGSPSRLAAVERLEDASKSVRVFAERLLVERVGWDLGLARASDPPARSMVQERFRVWLHSDLEAWRNSEPWESRIGMSLEVLPWNVEDEVLDDLLPLLQRDPTRGSRDVFRALRLSRAGPRHAAWKLLLRLGASPEAFDPFRDPADTEPDVRWLEEWYAARDH